MNVGSRWVLLRAHVKSIGQNAGALHLLKSLFLPTLYTVTHGDDGLVENAVFDSRRDKNFISNF